MNSKFDNLTMPSNPPQLKLGEHSREKNATFEAHDPSMFKDPITHKYYSYSTDAKVTSKHTIGIQIRRSEDLVNWEYIGLALSDKAIKQGRDNGPKFKATEGFWAPFVEYVDGEYRMYYSATKAFGSSESRIWLAVSDNPEGKFENRGVVMDTWDTDDTYPNAIDPHVVNTPDGEKYFIYGSFFGGIYIKPLDVKTGLPLNSDVKELGKCIARKSELTLDGPEGPAIIYNPDTQYYYLFISYGWLGDNYDIRVGRSKNPCGPYLDFNGKNMVGETMGLKLANSYQFTAKNPNADLNCKKWSWGGFRGPGHGVPFYDEDTKDYYFVHHIRDGAESLCMIHPFTKVKTFTHHNLFIRKMSFIDAWPVFSPECYAGEDNLPVDKKYLEGDWEVIKLDDNDNEPKFPKKMTIGKDTPELDGIKGSYSYLNDILTLSFDKFNIKAKVFKCWDFENSKPTICFSGISDAGIAYWGKLIY